MRSRTRKAKVSVFEVLAGEIASLYEMGLPIVETGDKWHVNVGQKVPLNRDRNNVRPAFLRTLRTLMLNEMNDRLTADEANDVWVRQASSDPTCSEAAIKRVLDPRFGEKRAAYDPNDPEANKKWVSMGGTVVHGGMLMPKNGGTRRRPVPSYLPADFARPRNRTAMIPRRPDEGNFRERMDGRHERHRTDRQLSCQRTAGR